MTLQTTPRGDTLDQNLWGAWDHETAEWLTDRDGNDTFDNYNDARDLEMEYR